tara:strand:+ start:636 stop:839 length:204 start_codon:yes stop_codon:yes gene_type:complete
VGDLVKNIQLLPELCEFGVVVIAPNDTAPTSIKVHWHGSNRVRGDYCYKSWIHIGDVEIVSEKMNKS